TTNTTQAHTGGKARERVAERSESARDRGPNAAWRLGGVAPMSNTAPRWVWRVMVATVVPAGVMAAAAPPGYADPGADPRAGGGPDAGAAPVASAPLGVPPLTPEPALPLATAISPLAEQIIAASAATQRLGEQTKALQDDLAAAHEVT